MPESEGSGKLVIVSGPSGVGKSTICRELAERLDAVLSVSATTRAPRGHEVDGREYRFMTTEAFEALLAEGGFLEHARGYSGHYYGTPAKPILEALTAGRTAILEIEIEGTIQVVQHYPEAVSIYVTAPTRTEQKKRLVGRAQDSDKAIEERMSKAEAEIAKARSCGAYRHFVVNEDLESTVDTIERICREDVAV